MEFKRIDGTVFPASGHGCLYGQDLTGIHGNLQPVPCFDTGEPVASEQLQFRACRDGGKACRQVHCAGELDQGSRAAHVQYPDVNLTQFSEGHNAMCMRLP